MSSKVYFADMYSKFGDNLLDKFERLLCASGLDDIDFQDKFVAVKVHFGEWGNMSFLRHQYAKVLCDHIKKRGGKVFLTDANTLYPGFRGNAVDHLSCASLNGYNELSCGVPVIIADGLRGTDEREIEVEGAEYVEKAKIGAAVAEADVIISLSHCKGHVEAGFGGAFKNIGMGCGSKKGKMEMHSSGTPAIDTSLCVGCGMCVKNCANNGVSVIDGKAVINEDSCKGCGYCFAYCPKGAIECKWDEARPVLSRKIAEYTKACLDGKPSFHINIAADVQNTCDCNGAHNHAIVPDVGFFASKDIVAVDQAAWDAINRQPAMPGGKLAQKLEGRTRLEDMDVFRLCHGGTDFPGCLEHAVKLGMGSREYELITVK